jgi:hypothetical protein
MWGKITAEFKKFENFINFFFEILPHKLKKIQPQKKNPRKTDGKKVKILQKLNQTQFTEKSKSRRERIAEKIVT